VRRREKRYTRATFLYTLHGKSAARRVAPSAHLRKKFAQAADIRVALTKIERRFFYVRVPKKKPGKLVSGVARCSDDGDL
jgi:hypothetical protein